MNNIFQTHTEFLTKDFRSNRPPELGIPVNPEITVQKHQLLLPPDVIKDKRILDIGSFIGQTGDWCLSNGAGSYTGVEISKDFCDISTELLNKYQPDRAWTIINQSMTDFFSTNQEKYDIIFCWGVIFGHHDHVWFMNELAKRSDHVILDSRHPKVMWRNVGDQLTPEFWKELEYTIPYTEWQAGDMTVLATVNASLRCTAAHSSIAALTLLMELNGFSADLTVYEKLKQLFPETFGMFRDRKQVGRFVIEFHKDTTAKHHSLVENIFEDPTEFEANYIDWYKK
jgi:hypothetical protein